MTADLCPVWAFLKGGHLRPGCRRLVISHAGTRVLKRVDGVVEQGLPSIAAMG